MAGFYFSLTDDEIASQIATLLNTSNQLSIQHTGNSIKNSASKYFIEVYGNIVAGCIGLTQTGFVTNKIHHLSVRPEFRRQGLGRRLVVRAIQECKTNYVFMTIREDNYPSLNLAHTLGFVPTDRLRNNDHFIVIAGRSVY